jgi:nucleotide-binding universal stress UspA family protein
MTPWKRICCAVDLTEASRIAMLKAAELAARFEGELVLLHVQPFPPALAGDFVVPAPQTRSVEAAAIEGALALWRDEAERVSGRPVRTALLTGDPAAAIAAFARDRDTDVLVVATHGRTGLDRLVMGSVAEKVVRSAGCTVVVARRHEPAEARARRAEASRRAAVPAEGPR